MCCPRIGRMTFLFGGKHTSLQGRVQPTLAFPMRGKGVFIGPRLSHHSMYGVRYLRDLRNFSLVRNTFDSPFHPGRVGTLYLGRV